MISRQTNPSHQRRAAAGASGGTTLRDVAALAGGADHRVATLSARMCHSRPLHLDRSQGREVRDGIVGIGFPIIERDSA